MKIGFDAKRFAVNKVGLGNYSRTLIRNLAELAPENKYYLYSPIPFNQELITFRQPESLIYKAPTTKPGALKQQWLRYIKIKEQVKSDKLDIFHGLSHTIPDNLDCPTVVTMHDLIFLRCPQFFPLTNRWIYEKTFKKSVKRADLIFSVSEATKEDLCYYFNTDPDKIITTYQSCNPEFNTDINRKILDKVKEKYKLPEHFILSLGTIEPRKNALNLVKGFAKIADKLKDYHLVFAGKETAYLKEIKEELKKSRLEDRAIFLSYVPYSDIPSLYTLADLFAYLSLIEGFGIPILEAMNCGTPSITSNCSSLKEVGGEKASVLVDPLNVDSIADGLFRALDNESFYKKLVGELPSQAEKFSPDNICKKVINGYKSLL